MPETTALFICLAVITAAAVAATVVLWMTASEVRATLRRVSKTAGAVEQTYEEARRVCVHARHLLTRTNRAVRRVDGVISKACGMASDALERVVDWQERLGSFWSEHAGNGTGSGGSRRRYRGS